MKLFFFAFSFLFSTISFAVEWHDPTEGKAFFPWVWEDQFLPTIKTAGETGWTVLGAGVTATVIARQYDETAYVHNKDESRRWFDSKTADYGGALGSGGPAATIVVAQLLLDQENGLRHGRAMALTAISHITLAGIAQRQRPNGYNYLSFPSGHASSAFATATSLAYAYGWKAGVPAFLAAAFIGTSRVNQDIHWLSDVVGGAALGIYWGRASALADTKKAEDYTILPVPLADGLMISFDKKF